MKSSITILTELFRLLNVIALTDNISGNVYIGDAPDTSQLEDVTIKTLTNSNSYLQTGYINLNVHVKEVQSGRSDMAKFRELINIIIPMVKDSSKNGVFFQIDDDKGIFKDQDKDSMYFYNLKLKFQTI